MIGEDKVIRLGGCKSGAACSIVLRGASSHVLDEAERSLHDALCILTATVKDPRIICGGGCTEILMAQAIDRQVESTPGKKALAMASFARALRQLPAIVADNGGYDSAELVTQLRAAHASGRSTYGLDMYNGAIADMMELGVAEAYKSKLCVLLSASEAAEMILRVDGEILLLHRILSIYLFSQISNTVPRTHLPATDIIKCAPRAREGH
jgi:T-complex protein 1 subunit beta